MKYALNFVLLLFILVFNACKKEIEPVSAPLKEFKFLISGDSNIFEMNVYEQENGNTRVVFVGEDSSNYYLKKGFTLKGNGATLLNFQNYKIDDNVFEFNTLDDNLAITFEEFIELGAYVEIHDLNGKVKAIGDFGFNYNSNTISFLNNYCTQYAISSNVNCNTGLIFTEKSDGYIISNLSACAYSSELQQNDGNYHAEIWSGNIDDLNSNRLLELKYSLKFIRNYGSRLTTYFDTNNSLTFNDIKSNDIHIRMLDKDNNILTKINAGSNAK